MKTSKASMAEAEEKRGSKAVARKAAWNPEVDKDKGKRRQGPAVLNAARRSKTRQRGSYRWSAVWLWSAEKAATSTEGKGGGPAGGRYIPF